jgi:hypothetical protein
LLAPSLLSYPFVTSGLSIVIEDIANKIGRDCRRNRKLQSNNHRKPAKRRLWPSTFNFRSQTNHSMSGISYSTLAMSRGTTKQKIYQIFSYTFFRCRYGSLSIKTYENVDNYFRYDQDYSKYTGKYSLRSLVGKDI